MTLLAMASSNLPPATAPEQNSGRNICSSSVTLWRLMEKQKYLVPETSL
jgi:hypothetical protein